MMSMGQSIVVTPLQMLTAISRSAPAASATRRGSSARTSRPTGPRPIPTSPIRCACSRAEPRGTSSR
jgi:hypothetical protein